MRSQEVKKMGTKGISKFGIVGASTTGMVSLVAASYYPEITLTMCRKTREDVDIKMSYAINEWKK